jgi:hypothetical protein
MKLAGKTVVHFERSPGKPAPGHSKQALEKEGSIAVCRYFEADGKLLLVSVIALSRTHPQLAELVKKQLHDGALGAIVLNYLAAGAPSVGVFVADRLIANIVMPEGFNPRVEICC